MELDDYARFDLFAHNREIWSRLHPTETGNLAATFAPSIILTTLSSQELEGWKSSLRLFDCQLLLVYGIDTGQAYLALREWLTTKPQHTLIFLESDARVLNAFFSTSMASDLLADSQVWLYYTPTIDTQIYQLEKLASIYPQYNPLLAQLPSSVVRPREYWHTINRCTKYFWQLHTANFNEKRHCATGFLQQLYNNLFFLPSSYSSTDLHNSFSSIPAIICGAGPSLTKNRTLLKNLSDKALILAGGTAINALNAEDIHPHIGFGIDPNPSFYHRILTSTSWQIPFMYYYRMFHPALAHVHGDKVLVDLKSSLPLPTWFHQQLQAYAPTSLDGQIHNVVHFSTLAALAFGCNPLIFVGLDLAYSDEASYAAGLKTSAVHRISNDFSTKSDSEEIVLRNDIYGNPVKTLWKWIIESSWYGNIARQYPERTFINATEGGIGLGDIPNLPLAAAAGIHLNNSWDISAHTHAAIQRCQKCLNEDKTDAINIAFDQLISSTQRCLKLINTSQEQLEQSSEPLEQQWQRSQFPLQNEMAGEAAFDYMLKSFDVYHTTMARQRFLRLEADRQRLTPTDILTIQRDIHLKRYQHFSLILAQQVVLLTHTKNEHKALVAKNIEPINEYDLSRDSKEVYSYVDNQVTIIDSSLQLELIDTAQQQLTEKQIPDNESKAFCTSYYNLEGQLHGPSTTYNKDGQLLTITWYFAGQKQGWSRYYWNDGALYCQLPYRNNALHGNASYLYNNGSLRSRIPYKEGQLHGTVELYYPNGQLHRRSEYSHGKRHGSEQVWQADGTLILDAHYLEDKPIGTASQWHFDGTLIRRTSYNASSEILNEEAWNAAGESVSAHFNHDESYLQKMYAQVQDLDSSLETVAKSFDTLGSYLIHYPSLYTIYQQDCKTLYDHKNTVKQLLILLDTSKQPHTQDTGEPLWRSPSFMRTVEKQRDDLIQALQQYLNKLHVWTTTLQAQGLE